MTDWRGAGMARSFKRYAVIPEAPATPDAQDNDQPVGRSPAEAAFIALKDVQADLGLSRIQMGAILCALEDTDGWQGKSSAGTFQRFIVEEGIEPKAARQYMQVARKFVFEMQLSFADLRSIAHASMRSLVEASRVATVANLPAVFDILQTLPRPEAIEALRDLAGAAPVAEPTQDRAGRSVSPPVNRIMNALGELTLTDRSTLYALLRLDKVPVQQ